MEMKMPEKELNEKKEKVIIIIPAYNEEKQIAAVVAESKREIPEAQILVVNDGSSDETEKRAREAGARVLTHPFNLGYGVALQTGYKFALKYGFDYVLQIDGDGQHDPRYLKKLLQELKKGDAEIVIGSRFLGEGSYKAPFLRRLGIIIFAWIAGKISGQKITDPTSGYQALSRRALKFYSTDIFPGDYPDADILIMLRRAGLRFREIPVNMHPNPNGTSMHNGLKPIYYTYKMCLCIMLNLLRSV